MGHRTCEQCGATFVPKTVKSRFCSRKCGNKSYNLARGLPCSVCGEMRTATPAQRAKGTLTCLSCRRKNLVKVRLDGHRRGSGVPQSFTCEACGEEWTRPPVRGQVPKWCPDCREKAAWRQAADRRRARLKGAFRAPVVRRKVFEADGWRCYICHRKLLRDVEWPHPQYPTLDHVIPMSRGGLHEPSNVRACCFECNSLKGDRGGNEQLILFG